MLGLIQNRFRRQDKKCCICCCCLPLGKEICGRTVKILVSGSEKVEGRRFFQKRNVALRSRHCCRQRIYHETVARNVAAVESFGGSIARNVFGRRYAMQF